MFRKTVFLVLLVNEISCVGNTRVRHGRVSDRKLVAHPRHQRGSLVMEL